MSKALIDKGTDMRNPILIGFAAAALLALQPLSSLAITAATPTLAPGAHVSGGISLEGQQDMLARQELYNLRLVFAEAKTGSYIAGVIVVIERADGGDAFGPFTDCGPLFFIKLAPGSYRVKATYNGVTQTKTVHIGKGALQSTLYWPSSAES